MSKITKSLHRHYSRFRERMTEEMGLQTLSENRYWRRRRDVHGRVFHSRAAATGKARSPMVERRVRRTTSNDVDAERRRWWASSADDWRSSSARYGGNVWCRHLYTRTASLNLMRYGTFSQCNCVRSGVMWSYLDAENTNRAAEFNADCIRLVRWDGMPAIVALP